MLFVLALLPSVVQIMDSWFFAREPTKLKPLSFLNAQNQVVQTSIYRCYPNPSYFQDTRIKDFIYDIYTQSFYSESQGFQIVYSTPLQVISEQAAIRLLNSGGIPLNYFWGDENSCRALAKSFSIPDGPVPLYLIIFHAFHDSIFVQKEDLDSCSLYDFLREKAGQPSGFQKLTEKFYIFTRPEYDVRHMCKPEETLRCSDGVLFCKTCSILKEPTPEPGEAVMQYRAKPLGKVILPERAMIEFIKRIEKDLTRLYRPRTKANAVDLKVVVFPHLDVLLKTRMVENFPSVSPHTLVALVMRYCVFMVSTYRKNTRSWEDVQKVRNRVSNLKTDAVTVANGLHALFKISVVIANLALT